MLSHLKTYCALVAVLVALFVGALVDSQLRCFPANTARRLKCISPLLPSADPGLNNSARYIRHLGLATPGSAFTDYPGQPDYLPSGMAWAPPDFAGLLQARAVPAERLTIGDGLP